MAYQYWPANQAFSVREEFQKLLFGDEDNPPIGRPVLLRRIHDQKCACWNEHSKSPNPKCRYCHGEGFLFTETMETAYITRNFGGVLNPSTVIMQQSVLQPYGYSDENRALAFVEYSVIPDYERYTRPNHPKYDALFELKVDDLGRLVTPLVRLAKWQVRSVTPHHGDWGRVEFFELGLQKEFA